MENRSYALTRDLCSLVSELGSDWGRLTPSIYDTVQVLRYSPPSDTRPALDWLCAQQQPDGGWGNPLFPHARDVPTLAALLALQTHQPDGLNPDVINEGLAFLHQHAPIWEEPLGDDIPVAVELILPKLLEACLEAGLQVPQRSYLPLKLLGRSRLRMLAELGAPAGSAPSHTWEMWGDSSRMGCLDGSGGVGHSPAATAYWLKCAGDVQVDPQLYQAAQAYMAQASAATGLGIPGVVPTVGPIYRFEQAWTLYALMLSGLTDYAPLRTAVRAQLDQLASALRPAGASMSDHFICDGDSTATALATLAGAGYPVDMALLQRYQRGEQFITYERELQPSLTATAHATHALALHGADVREQVAFLLGKQQSDGRWVGDKWHNSWLYATSQTMIAIAHGGYGHMLGEGLDRLLLEQHCDGGWGQGQRSTPAETAFAVHTLYALWSLGCFAETIALSGALARAYHYLWARYDAPVVQHYWIGKELYTPFRVDRAFVLSALLLLTLRSNELWQGDMAVENNRLPR